MVALTFNPSTWMTEAGGSEFKANLIYRVSSRTARSTQKNPVLKKKKKKKKNKKPANQPTKQTNKQNNKKKEKPNQTKRKETRQRKHLVSACATAAAESRRSFPSSSAH
jgi:outer membrane biosynthesis protein TonB